jgi:BirA family biotin operon repressor/biotin-[acetyl-CoA-carboxylase] ligase
MVNEKNLSVKCYLLNKLREDPGIFFTGAELSRETGVSRVAVWKQAKALAEAGYPVEQNDKGYRFMPPSPVRKGGPADDFLYPWEFGGREKLFHHWVSTDSTMNRAAELAARNYPGGSVITAGEQTAGRGRNGRPWSSKKGGLFFTLLERPPLPALEYTRLSMAAQIAAARALTSVCGRRALLRWPNDIYIDEKKIAGVLTEFHAEGDRLVWVSIGIGVNVNNKGAPGTAAHCAAFLRRPLSRRTVLLAVLDEWDKVKNLGPDELRKMWNAAGEGIGRRVRVIENKDGGKDAKPVTSGVFLGVDMSGKGLVKPGGKNQDTRRFPPGLVSFLY